MLHCCYTFELMLMRSLLMARLAAKVVILLVAILLNRYLQNTQGYNVDHASAIMKFGTWWAFSRRTQPLEGRDVFAEGFELIFLLPIGVAAVKPQQRPAKTLLISRLSAPSFTRKLQPGSEVTSGTTTRSEVSGLGEGVVVQLKGSLCCALTARLMPYASFMLLSGELVQNKLASANHIIPSRLTPHRSAPGGYQAKSNDSFQFISFKSEKITSFLNRSKCSQSGAPTQAGPLAHGKSELFDWSLNSSLLSSFKGRAVSRALLEAPTLTSHVPFPSISRKGDYLRRVPWHRNGQSSCSRTGHCPFELETRKAPSLIHGVGSSRDIHQPHMSCS